MAERYDLQEALRCIKAEAKAKTGLLSLLGLKIDRLPDALAHLPHLIALNCSKTQITSLAELEHCPNLTSLNCSRTSITSLAGLEHCQKLTALNCSETPITSLAGLEHCRKLTELDCAGTQITSLAGLEHCKKLTTLYCSDTQIADPSEFLWDRPSLNCVFFVPGSLADVPSEFLSKNYSEDCLPRLRDYFRARRLNVESVRTTKLFLLGNGAVGKTQLGRMLRDEPFDPSLPTTHGVGIHRFSLPPEDQSVPITVNLWDFGGQQLYHGTHALFLRERAVYLLAWAPGHEAATHTDVHRLTHKNHPLAYWLDYVEAVRGQGSALLIVQTQCDAEGVQFAAVGSARLDGYVYVIPGLATSAQTGRGKGPLRASLAEAAAAVLEHARDTEISSLWATVGRRLADLRPDPASPEAPNKVKSLSRPEFEHMCRDIGLNFGFDTLLYYLNATGEIIYRPDYFNEIILDQNWLQDAIYTLFERGDCWQFLQRQQGRFTQQDLAERRWNREGYSVNEQSLFLSYMVTCGLCFAHYQINENVYYIAPSALPPLDAALLPQSYAWQDGWQTLEARFEFDFLHDGFIRRLIAEIGEALHLDAVYGVDGVQIWDVEHGWRGRLRVIAGEGNAGTILAETQYRDASAEARATQILNEMCDLIVKNENETGLRARLRPEPGTRRKPAGEKAMDSEQERIIVAAEVPQISDTPLNNIKWIINKMRNINNRTILSDIMILLGIPPVEWSPNVNNIEIRACEIREWAYRENKLDELAKILKELSDW